MTNVLRDQILEIIRSEPELPGKMPDELWNVLNGNREATELAQRAAVISTKNCILKRIEDLFAKGS